MKILIVGAVAGGATAVARLRRLSEENELIMFEKDEFISYANCGLPYYIGDVIVDKQKLQVQTVKGMSARYNVDIRVKSEVTDIDLGHKTIKVKNLTNGEVYEERYDKLLLSCGAKPIRPNINGIEKAKNVFTLRNIPDTIQIKEFVVNNSVKNAVVIGGGFIGVEMAENLRHIGVNVTLVEKSNQVLGHLDFEMAQLAHQELSLNGVNLILGDGVSSFENDGKNIKLESGKSIDTDMTILAIGVTPENTLAKGANLKLGVRGHIITTQNFNVISKENGEAEKDVYAIGDMIEVINSLDDSSYAVSLAWGANRQGRLVADHICGREIKQSKIMGASVLKLFDITVASTGASEALLRSKGIEYTAIHAHRANHANYYPNSSNIALKLLYQPKTGKIFGAQAVGKDGTEKRIDVISTVMRLGGSVYELSDLELCYAPPYGSAKDPVNILGYIAENIEEGVYKVVHHYDIDKIVKEGGFLIDVRTAFEFGNGHIDGAVNIEVDELRKNLDKITVSKDTPIYVNCQVGLRAYIAIKILYNNGYTNLYNLSGGYATYKAFKYRIKNNNTVKTSPEPTKKAKNSLDVSGLQCPGPLMATYKKLNTMKEGEELEVTATDCAFTADIDSWCKTNGHTLVNLVANNGKYVATVKKGEASGCGCTVTGDQKNATIVVFSGELDKVLASMIIAQGAVAQGKNVTMFFTFWGLNALRKSQNVTVKKTLIEKMFGFMMPRGADKLPLSNMNMLGIGSKMIKGIMKQKNVDSLPDMIKKAQEMGVNMIACSMSMDLMGIKPEELIDGISYAGVATYISKNENVGTTLFI